MPVLAMLLTVPRLTSSGVVLKGEMVATVAGEPGTLTSLVNVCLKA
jgi:hypothetical protein